MADDNCEIEYLDEDEDLIQQYVTGQKPDEKPVQKIEESTTDCEDSDELNATIASLVRKREIETNKKAIKYETDSEYNPTEGKKNALHKTDSECNPAEYKKKATEYKRKATKNKKKSIKYETDSDYDPTEDLEADETEDLISQSRTNTRSKKSKPAITDLNLGIRIKDMRIKRIEQELTTKTVEYNERKNFKIRMPDFEDPLCLPVRAIRKEDIDVNRLNVWNKSCLEQYNKYYLQHSNNIENSKIVCSSKTTLFKNFKRLGATETMAYFSTRTCKQYDTVDRVTDSCQSMLPTFRERRGWQHFDMVREYPRKFKHRSEVLLTKEKLNNEDVLVVYKPGDSTSTVTRMVKERGVDDDNPPRKVLEEIALTRMCASCYQMSWRGHHKDKKSELLCKICNRTFSGVYSMLTHVKTYHNDGHVRRYKEDLSRAVANAVSYHYKCRVCQLNCTSVKQLRKHVVTHKGDEVFKCEVGNHMAS